MLRQTSLLSETLATGPGFIEAWAKGQGLWPIAGVDEAGRGCLAGPVVAAAVVLPEGHKISGLDDSKRLSPKVREELEAEIRQRAVAAHVAEVSPQEIDLLGILKATLKAMREAVEAVVAVCPWPIALVVVDGNVPIPDLSLPQKTWVKGDRLSFNCASASILAKVARDRLMEAFDRAYPGYGFAIHKGYATKGHLEALLRLGPCPIHRRSFGPVRALLEGPTSPRKTC